MVSIRRVACGVLLVGMVPAGLACVSGDRDAPEWELISANAPSGSSSGNSSNGTGGSSSGTGGSSSGTAGAGGSSSGTGGSGGSLPTCDGTNDCGGCVTCAITGACEPLWTACQGNPDCLDEADCELQCALGAADVDAFNTCVSSLCTVPGGFDQVWPCFCTQSCEADCAAASLYHCVLFMP